jgi:hypothetical protein
MMTAPPQGRRPPTIVLAITGVVLIIAAAAASSLVGPRRTPEQALERRYETAVRQYYPMWYLAQNGGEAEVQRSFQRTLDDLRQTLARRGGDPSTTVQVASILLDRWPKGYLSYNMNWVLGHARDWGLLDRHFRPIPDAPFINEDARLAREQADLLEGARS